MKKRIFGLLIVLIALAAIYGINQLDAIVAKAGNDAQNAETAKVQLATLTDQLEAVKQSEADRAALIQFTLYAMDMEPKTKISDAQKPIVAEKVVKFVMRNIHILGADNVPNESATQVAREQYISMVKIESNFDNRSRSPVGAQGIGQIMPGTFAGVAKLMNKGARADDIQSEDVNLDVGTFYFNLLLSEQMNNPRFASIAYNGGPKTADRFKKLADINQESANYALKTDHVRETVKEQVDANKPK